MAAAEMSAPDGRLVLDFANVEWLASTVFRPIMQTLKTMRGNGGRYSSTGGGPLVHTMLRFFPDLGLLDTKAEAIAALSPEARVIYGREEGQR